jgi:hypothetical protein
VSCGFGGWSAWRGWVPSASLRRPWPAVSSSVSSAGAFGSHEVFLEVYRGGSRSWIGALALTLPTALVGLVGAFLVLRRRRGAVATATTFALLVAVCATISIANVAPVRPFLDDWQRVTSDPRAAHHAAERRVNSAIGAVAVAAALLFAARRRRPLGDRL